MNQRNFWLLNQYKLVNARVLAQNYAKIVWRYTSNKQQSNKRLCPWDVWSDQLKTEAPLSSFLVVEKEDPAT